MSPIQKKVSKRHDGVITPTSVLSLNLEDFSDFPHFLHAYAEVYLTLGNCHFLQHLLYSICIISKCWLVGYHVLLNNLGPYVILFCECVCFVITVVMVIILRDYGRHGIIL